jgi:hypothetical protein
VVEEKGKENCKDAKFKEEGIGEKKKTSSRTNNEYIAIKNLCIRL